jgi:formylmethanofuran dehydrogenase subunit E
MDKENNDLEKCIKFHGHLCPGLAIGYRAAKIGLQELAGKRSSDEELVAIVENDACGVDAVMVITGCTLGKGNLLLRDFGKRVYTFMSRQSGDGVRIYVKAGNTDAQSGALQSMPDKVQQILDLPQDEFCAIQHFSEELPEPARIFNSITCAFCGEAASEARARVKDGKFACIPCAGQYQRHIIPGRD